MEALKLDFWMGEAESWWIKANFSLFVEILMDFFNTEEKALFSAAFVFVKMYFSSPPRGKLFERGIVFVYLGMQRLN